VTEGRRGVLRVEFGGKSVFLFCFFCLESESSILCCDREGFFWFWIYFFDFFFRPQQCLVRVRINDERGEAEVSQWTLR